MTQQHKYVGSEIPTPPRILIHYQFLKMMPGVFHSFIHLHSSKIQIVDIILVNVHMGTFSK